MGSDRGGRTLVALAQLSGFWPGGASRCDAGLTRSVVACSAHFQSLGSDKSADFLRLALPDEIVTTLSRSPSLAIRPFASARKYDKSDADRRPLGKESAWPAC